MTQFPLRKCLSFVLVGFVVALVAGCGGSEEPGGPVSVEAGSLSKAEFIEKANAICAERLKRVGAVFTEYLKQHGVEPTTSDVRAHAAEVVDAILPAFQPEIDGIRSLGAPRSEEKTISELLTALQWNLDEAEAQPKKFLAKEGRFARFEELAQDYGLTECAAF